MVARVRAGYYFVFCELIIGIVIGADHACMQGSDGCLNASPVWLIENALINFSRFISL